MAPRTIFPIVDKALGGKLEARLRKWRPSVSFDEIANRLRSEGIDVNGETIRRWCDDLGIPKKAA
jgi:hypothetical protein